MNYPKPYHKQGFKLHVRRVHNERTIGFEYEMVIPLVGLFWGSLSIGHAPMSHLRDDWIADCEMLDRNRAKHDE